MLPWYQLTKADRQSGQVQYAKYVQQRRKTAGPTHRRGTSCTYYYSTLPTEVEPKNNLHQVLIAHHAGLAGYYVHPKATVLYSPGTRYSTPRANSTTVLSQGLDRGLAGTNRLPQRPKYCTARPSICILVISPQIYPHHHQNTRVISATWKRTTALIQRP